MTDHKAEAEKWLDPNVWREAKAADNEVPTLVAIGHVHATLYLAEQQRIANLIALGTEYLWGQGSEGDYFMRLRPEIREGLGLS